MRVAMVIQSFLPVLGGAQRQVDLLGPLLAERGVETSVVTRHPAGTSRREHRRGLAIRRLPGPDSGPLGSIAYTVGGAAAVAVARPDVVHVHDLLSPASIALLSRPVARAPIVAKVLSTGPGGDIDRLLTKPMGARRLRSMTERFAAFICLSPEVAAELNAHGVGAERLHMIPNGVDAQRYRPPADESERRRERAAAGLDPERPLVLYSGRFDPVKRIDKLIDAFARTEGATLALVGDGPLRDEIAALAGRDDLRGRVHVLGRVDDPAPLYRCADLYVSASSTEGMSNSVLEAMASGVPVVALDASGMDQLVTTETGILLPGDADSDQLSAAIEALTADPARRELLGAAARRLVVDSYSLDATADGLTSLYREVCARDE